MLKPTELPAQGICFILFDETFTVLLGSVSNDIWVAGCWTLDY